MIDALDDIKQALDIFNDSTDTYVYIKNSASEFIYANETQIKFLGFYSFDELAGKTDHDLFETHIAELYIAEDQEVLSGKEIINKRWMIPDNSGNTQWFLSSKKPFYDKDKKVIAIIGVVRNLKSEQAFLKPYQDLNPAIEYISEHIHSKICIQALAEMTGLSISQFDRKFKILANSTPTQYIFSLKLSKTAELLKESNMSISEITYQMGFYDQSHMTRLFKKKFALSPLQYRKANSNIQR